MTTPGRVHLPPLGGAVGWLNSEPPDPAGLRGRVAHGHPRRSAAIVSAAVTAPEITIATPADRPAVVGSLVAAFVKDPVLRYLFPDEETYPRYAAAFFGNLFDKRVHRSSIWTIGGGASVAIWEPPADGSLAPEGSLAAHYPADVLGRVEGYDAAVHAALPEFPYWYLGVLGTHPDSAGRGWGRAVMRAGLDRAAADGLPAILETSKPANVELYRRAGWEVVRYVAEPLPTWIMQQPGAAQSGTSSHVVPGGR